MKPDIIPAYNSLQEIGQLFTEYTDYLVEENPSVKAYLQIQDYEKELSHLGEKYGPPYGRLYLACLGDHPAGCIGLQKLDAQTGEMKRLYVRPEFRGHRIGRHLIEKVIGDARDIGYTVLLLDTLPEKVIGDARDIGYTVLLLDTLPFLQNAISLYRQYGFYEIPRYNDSPPDSSIYMRLDL